jgi:hypothetical protein
VLQVAAVDVQQLVVGAKNKGHLSYRTVFGGGYRLQPFLYGVFVRQVKAYCRRMKGNHIVRDVECGLLTIKAKVTSIFCTFARY